MSSESLLSRRKAVTSEALKTTMPSSLLAHPLCRCGSTYVLLIFYLKKNNFSDLCQTNYLNVDRIDLYEICRIGRTLAVDERPGSLFFSIPQEAFPLQPTLWTKSTCNTNFVVRMTFAGAAPAAYDKKGNCYTGRRQTNHLAQCTQANRLTDQLTVINRRRGG